METITPCGVLQIGSTLLGQHLQRAIKIHKGTRKFISQSSRSYDERCVERAFGILEAQFAMVLRGPARLWNKDTLWHLMIATMIMHTMIFKDKRGEDDHEA